MSGILVIYFVYDLTGDFIYYVSCIHESMMEKNFIDK